MRDIKFRTWDKDNNKIIFNYCKKNKNEIVSLMVSESKLNLMQYIGLKDKNGKEIFEGDIVILFGVNMPTEIIFKNGAFGYFGDIFKEFVSIAGNSNFNFDLLEIEIIGNIYEHKHLLEIK